jgi:putative CocE/NonD family hydrolase
MDACPPSLLRRGLTAVALSVAVLLATSAPSPAATAAGWTPYDRPAQYTTVTEQDVPIAMPDGTVLRADVTRPDAPGRFPVLITQTPYNKTGPLGMANAYLVQRGYVHVVVDVRGTGSSGGTWDSFGPNEQADGPEIVRWATQQPWSDGKIGLTGASYMGFTQLYTAAQRPEGLKAIFPVVPMADGYRDITMSGGQVNISFIPLWLGLVSGGAIVPPAWGVTDPAGAAQTLADHVRGVVDFQAHTVTDATTGGDTAFDGDFWKTRSPIEVLDRIRVPAFVVGGLHDLFQRGEPLVYERLKQHVPARLLMGPWTHLGGSSGAGLPADGVPSLAQIQLRWFDRWLKGIDTRVAEIPRATQYVWGAGHYETQADWPDPSLRPTRAYLRAGGELSRERPSGDEPGDTFVQHPVSGICTQTTSQWSAGLTEQLPCTTDDRLNEAGEKTWTTAPLEQPLRLDGPILAKLWVTTTASDAVTAVRITDVAPDGKSTELTAGWLAASFRATDRSRSRVVRRTLIQPWHPFTRASVLPVPKDQPVKLEVEVFPTSALLQPGHRLRVAVGPGDFPHQVPPLPQLQGSLGGQVTILHDRAHPSSVVLPERGTCPRSGCRSLKVPRLLRGG